MQNKSSNLIISKIKINKKKNQAKADLFYKYLEKRNYIQGVVVLDGMLMCCKKLLPSLENKPFHIIEAKILSEINSGTTAIAYFNENKIKKKKLAFLKIKQNSKIIECILVKNSNKLSKNYREQIDVYGQHVAKIYLKKKSAICKIKNIHTIIDLIRAIEECQRDIIKIENPNFSTIRWGYLTKLLVNEKKLNKLDKIKFYKKKTLKYKNSIFDIRNVDFYKKYFGNNPEFCFNAY